MHIKKTSIQCKTLLPCKNIISSLYSQIKSLAATGGEFLQFPGLVAVAEANQKNVLEVCSRLRWEQVCFVLCGRYRQGAIFFSGLLNCLSVRVKAWQLKRSHEQHRPGPQDFSCSYAHLTRVGVRDLVGRPAVQRHPQGLSGRHNTPSVKGGKGGRRRWRGKKGLKMGGRRWRRPHLVEWKRKVHRKGAVGWKRKPNKR